MKAKTLPQLLNGIPIHWSSQQKIPDVVVNSIQLDSRKVSPGDVFVAVIGGSQDGHNFIEAAITQGAVAVVGTNEIVDLKVPYLKVEDSREMLAYLAAAIYDHPGRNLTVIGVTGTDGKTTTSNLIFQILQAIGLRSGMISTVNAVVGNKVIDTGFHVTTPEATDVQEYLASMVEAGLTHVILETTSHGLAQHRVTGCEFDIAVVTNITHEHLDYHGSYGEYLAAKSRLFSGLEKTTTKKQGNPRLSVLNFDDGSYASLKNIVTGNQLSYGLSQEADLVATEISYSPGGVDFTAAWKEERVPVHCNLPGKFNISNCLAALATAKGLGIELSDAAKGIAAMQGVPGRMEWINLGQPFAAIVDFAHTPNALQQALETARQMTTGRVIAVFGSAGLRDRQKRRMMAEVSISLADITILTAEDPRTESLDAILAQMADAAEQAGGIEGKTFYRVPDRGEAIRLGVHLAQPGDLVMACGKGHEQSMCFGMVEYNWDDRIAMRGVLAELLNVPGEKVPILPTTH